MTPQSLRSRLLVTTIALLLGVGLVIGVVTTIALRHTLNGQLNTQLEEAAGRSQRLVAGDFRGGGVPRPGLPGFDADDTACATGSLPALGGPGQVDGTLYAQFVGGRVDLADTGVLEISATQACSSPLTGAQAAQLRSVAGDGQHTVDLDGLGDYRVSATTRADGSVAVTGLPLDGVNRTVLSVIAVEAGALLVGVAAAAVLGSVLIRRDLLPLRRVAATAGRVSELQLDRGDVGLEDRVPLQDTDENTEVGRVGLALNRMLDHVSSALEARHASELQVRQFVADASHELRTPLAAIRGYSELTRRSRDAVPPDVLHAMGRVESEAVRMTGLVEDLLLLARLDAGRPLERRPVDLTMIVLDAVSDAQVAGRDHTWRLDLPDEVVEVVGDQGRLHQVLTNLLANARTHTPPGTTVTVGIRAEGGAAHLDVVDDGPGIPPQTLPHVFERFARGDSSRSREAGSTGLGLAIVDAVVASHHGAVSVQSTPGRTAFRVTLPTA
ncbi:HAMP domain-containing protein [Kineosporiaceae bacterium B12]|nr:HAMP domain-containing protein [Kineococcus rubinsiae]